jgi:hypothetical protein
MAANEEGSVLDEETGLPNRGCWDAMLEAEELRTARHGGRHGLIRVVLRQPGIDGALAQKVAALLGDTLREVDVLARIDDREFAILALHCDSLETVTARLRSVLAGATPSVPAVFIARTAGADLSAVWTQLETGARPEINGMPYVDFVARTQPCLT